MREKAVFVLYNKSYKLAVRRRGKHITYNFFQRYSSNTYNKLHKHQKINGEKNRLQLESKSLNCTVWVLTSRDLFVRTWKKNIASK